MTRSVTVVVPVGRIDEQLVEQLSALSAQSTSLPVEFLIACNTGFGEDLTDLETLFESLDDSRFMAIQAADRRGAAYARNVGAAAATGDVLAFCDSDDVVHEGWLENLVRGLDSFDAVGGRLIDSGLTERYARARPPSTPDSLPEFLGVPYMGSGNMAIARHAFDAVGGFDEGLIRCEDIALSWQLIASGYRIGFASEACVTYRHRDGIWPMLTQHFAYGRGMGEVLVRYGVPGESGWSKPTGIALLRPNTQPAGVGGGRNLLGYGRRLALALGRAIGLLEEHWRMKRVASG